MHEPCIQQLIFREGKKKQKQKYRLLYNKYEDQQQTAEINIKIKMMK